MSYYTMAPVQWVSLNEALNCPSSQDSIQTNNMAREETVCYGRQGSDLTDMGGVFKALPIPGTQITIKERWKT